LLVALSRVQYYPERSYGSPPERENDVRLS